MSDTEDNIPKISISPLCGHFIATIDYQPSTTEKSSEKIETVVILDRSSSMGGCVKRIVNEILPLCFQKLNYKLDEKIHLITFDSLTEYHHLSIEELKQAEIYSRGCTYMNTGVSEFHNLLKKFNTEGVKFVRILTLSDGDVYDSRETIINAEQLAAYAQNCDIAISSHAIRWFTSSYDPDTTALCCLLQLNNVKTSKMLDITFNASTEEAALEFAGLLEDDGLSKSTVLNVESELILKLPWDLEYGKNLQILPGRNTFWLKSIPDRIIIDDQECEIEIFDSISYEKLQNILQNKIEFIIDKMKVLKIIDSANASGTINRIVEYFKRIESEVLIPDDYTPTETNKLQNRLKLFIFRTKFPKISSILSEIARDDKVHKLNSAQKAAYLRQAAISKTSVSLAKRSAKCTKDLTFDEIAKIEAQKIADYFHEIADIDDKSHEVSFYSQATTLEGIRTLVDFTKEEEFESATVTDILELLNIVGVACNGPVGDYPDASTWRINNIFPSCFVSVSDILCVLYQNANNKLLVPAYDAEITNSIPIFDDPRIGKFLKRHAPSLLEFTFSIGMRQMIAEVPRTIEYTMVAGVRGMIDLINNDKSTKNLEIFKNMVVALENFAGKSDVEAYLTEKSESDKNGYFLDNTGISGMMVPLIRLIRSNSPKIMKFLPAMLRSIYNYEVWLSVRRNYKGKENHDLIIKEMMIKLLGIDVNKHKVNVDEADPNNLTFYDNFHPNYEYVTELTNYLKHLDAIALIVPYLEASINGSLESIRDIPCLCKDTFLEALEIDSSFENYMFLNVFQALSYTTKQERCDTDNNAMKIIDLKHSNEAIEDVKSYVRNFFQKLYKFEMNQKIQMEEIRTGNTKKSRHFYERYLEQLQREPMYAKLAVKKIIESTTHQEMIEAWRDGVEWHGRIFKISSPGYFGFRLLKFALASFALEIPMRSDIIRVLFLGVDYDNTSVWNDGKAYIILKRGRRFYEPSFLYNSSYTDWNGLMDTHSRFMMIQQ